VSLASRWAWGGVPIYDSFVPHQPRVLFQVECPKAGWRLVPLSETTTARAVFWKGDSLGSSFRLILSLAPE
jgi:hypothetical protein